LQGPPAVSFPSSTGFSTNSASSNIDDLKRLRDERLKRLDDQFYAKNKTLFLRGIISHIGVDVRAWRDYRRAINRDFEQKKATSTSAASRVSFGSTTQAASTTQVAAPATGAFSFGGSTSAVKSPAPTATSGSLSFGGPATSKPATPAPAEGSDEPADDIGVSKPEAVEQNVDPNWKEVLAIAKVKYYIYEDEEGFDAKQCKPYPTCPLRLEQHVKDPLNRRMVIRELSAGRVRLNLKIAPGMPTKIFGKPEKKFLSIFAIRDADKGPEQFLFRATPEFFEKLVAKVTEWTKA
jgi:hypothetical protein